MSSKIINSFEQLFRKLRELLPPEKPSLIHGDLWNGNILCGPHTAPFLIDPAVYFGNREIELAFTMMFGGFDKEFYQSYNEAFPLLPGFDDRVDLYQLYPLLVHLNLFGPSYLAPIERTLKRF